MRNLFRVRYRVLKQNNEEAYKVQYRLWWMFDYKDVDLYSVASLEYAKDKIRRLKSSDFKEVYKD